MKVQRQVSVSESDLSSFAPCRSPAPRAVGARALLTFLDLEVRTAANTEMLAALFDFTPAEARLAALAATGLSSRQAVRELQVTVSTARNQLKAVFAKTGTQRQSELVVLISRPALP
jgi:DNA-binding CsgD family transcriptional regulator